MYETEQALACKAWPDYRAVWRWHFYAGLFCIPFVTVLATSGSIYLFKPQIEAWIDRHYDNLTIKDHSASAADQVRAALAAIPGSSLNAYEVPEEAGNAARVIVSHDGKATRVYVHPESLQVLKTVDENARFMKVLFRLHGELLMGNRGSTVVELAASWAIIMIVTGLYLWWPRKAKTLGGVVYPRLKGGSRMFWRDIHGVTGFWISGMALFLLLSGLPWAKFWGDYLRNVRRLTGTAGRAAGLDQRARLNGKIQVCATGGRTQRTPRAHWTWLATRSRGYAKRSDRLDKIVATVRPLHLLPPVVIEPPRAGSSDWTAKSATPNRPRRVDLVVDGKTGAIKDRKDFKDRHLIDRIVGTGIAAHEGQLFGWPNQLLGLFTAMGLVLLSVSSVVMWRRRREPGLGAPVPSARPSISFGLIALIAMFGIYLPLFGASLILVLVLEWTVLCRIPSVRDWLGLQPPAAPIEVTT